MREEHTGGDDDPVAIVLVAMPEEAQPFIARAAAVSGEETYGQTQERTLTFAGFHLVLVTGGIGFVNAASSGLAASIRHPHLPLVNAGTAGGLGDTRVGDVVIGRRVVNTDADVTAFGYALGQVPGQPAEYPGDASLLGLFAPTESAAADDGQTVKDSMPPHRITVREADTAEPAIREGLIGSGEAFVTSKRAGQLKQSFPELLAVDMESAALAQLARNWDLRFISVRGISDLCTPDGSEFATHVDDAAARCADVVLQLCEHIARQTAGETVPPHTQINYSAAITLRAMRRPERPAPIVDAKGP